VFRWSYDRILNETNIFVPFIYKCFKITTTIFSSGGAGVGGCGGISVKNSVKYRFSLYYICWP
jgi:hypothetical protein